MFFIGGLRVRDKRKRDRLVEFDVILVKKTFMFKKIMYVWH